MIPSLLPEAFNGSLPYFDLHFVQFHMILHRIKYINLHISIIHSITTQAQLHAQQVQVNASQAHYNFSVLPYSWIIIHGYTITLYGFYAFMYRILITYLWNLTLIKFGLNL